MRIIRSGAEVAGLLSITLRSLQHVMEDDEDERIVKHHSAE